MRKVPKSYFNRFRREILRLLGEIGISDWRVYFEFQPPANGTEMAWIRTNVSDHRVTFGYTTLAQDLADLDPELSAAHEVGHLLTANLHYIARCRFIRPDDTDDEWERLAVLLEKILVKAYGARTGSTRRKTK